MIEELTHDAEGTARWIDREASSLQPYHYARELIVNAWDAGATRVVIDGWSSPEGYELARFSDNGTGMNTEEAVNHGRTLHRSGKNRADNYGVGGRLATLTANPAGVTWASIAHYDKDAFDYAMVRLVKENGCYGLRIWDVDGMSLNAVEPTERELDQIGPDTGTAVILHGNGRQSTFTGETANGIDTFLTRRFFSFRSDVVLKVPGSAQKQSHRLVPFGDRLIELATSFGQVVVDEYGSVAHWWLLPPTKERQRESSHTVTAVAALANDELFDMVFSTETRARYQSFGITTRSVKSLVAIIVEPGFPVAMSTNRARLERAGGGELPWDEWGHRFYEDLPEQIRDLLAATQERSDFDDSLAKAMDEDWFTRINPTPILVRAPDGERDLATQELLSTWSPRGTESEGSSSRQAGVSRPPRKVSAGTPRDANERGTVRFSIRPPAVRFIEADEWTEDPKFWAVYHKTINEVHLRKDAVVFTLATERFMREFPRVVPETIAARVQEAYGQEAAMKAVHILSQARYGWLPRTIDEALAAPAMSAALLGLNAIETAIQSGLRSLVRYGT